MKILAFVDLHGSFSAIQELEKKAEKADLLVCAGDISIFEQNLDRILHELSKIGKPLLMIHGNHETEELLKKECIKFENIKFIHKKRFDFKNYIFLGYGGGGFSVVDPDFERFAEAQRKKLKESDNVVLITHAPPYKTNVDKIGKDHHGNKSIADFIKKVDINLVICGHLHENMGKEDLIGKTRIINPGHKGVVIEI